MALCAVGDMTLDVLPTARAASFALAHGVAISLYLKYRRQAVAGSQHLAGIVVLAATPFIALALTRDVAVTLYAALLGAMAAAAWTSAFPRYRVGSGAMLFVASDLLLFARMGPLAGNAIAGVLIWPMYYFGQFMICTGAIGFLRRQGQFSEE